MGINWIHRLWYDVKLTTSERAVLQVIGDYANEKGEGWTSYAQIAWQIDQSERNVKRIVTDLVGRGILSVMRQGGGRRANTYRIDLSKAEAKPPRPELRGDRKSPLKGSTRGDRISPQQCHPRHPSSDAGVTPVLSNNKTNTPRAKGTVRRAGAVPKASNRDSDRVVRAVINDWQMEIDAPLSLNAKSGGDARARVHRLGHKCARLHGPDALTSGMDRLRRANVERSNPMTCEDALKAVLDDLAGREGFGE